MAIKQTNNLEIKEDIIDIDIAPIKRKKFRLNGDNNKIIELNTSDLGIATRLEKGWKALQDISNKISSTDTNEDDFADKLSEYDKAMREQIDYIFDYPVADKASDGGTMYDPYGGILRYEHIIETLLKLYETNIEKEFSAIKKRVTKHTDKYTTKPTTTRRNGKK